MLGELSSPCIGVGARRQQWRRRRNKEPIHTSLLISLGTSWSKDGESP